MSPIRVSLAAVAVLLTAGCGGESGPQPYQMSDFTPAATPATPAPAAVTALSVSDANYLRSVRQRPAFSGVSNQDLIAWGRDVCNQLGAGATTFSSSQFTPDDTGALVYAAAAAYCPDTPGDQQAHAGTFTDGVYLVGSDIQPGTYTTPGSQSGGKCYWERMRDLDNGARSIAGNDFFSGRGVVSVKSGDVAVKFAHGCTWAKKE